MWPRGKECMINWGEYLRLKSGRFFKRLIQNLPRRTEEYLENSQGTGFGPQLQRRTW